LAFSTTIKDSLKLNKHWDSSTNCNIGDVTTCAGRLAKKMFTSLKVNPERTGVCFCVDPVNHEAKKQITFSIESRSICLKFTSLKVNPKRTGVCFCVDPVNHEAKNQITFSIESRSVWLKSSLGLNLLFVIISLLMCALPLMAVISVASWAWHARAALYLRYSYISISICHQQSSDSKAQQ